MRSWEAPRTATIQALLMTAALLVATAPSLAGGSPSTDPADPAHLIGGEVLVYQLDEGDFGNLHPGSVDDLSGNGSHGTIVGDPQRVSSDLGYGEALAFDATDDRVRVDVVSALDRIGPEATLAAWVNQSGSLTGGDNQIVEVRTDDGTEIMDWLLDGSIVEFRAAGSSGESNWRTNFAVPTDQWVHLAIVFNDGDLSLLVDGELQDATEAPFSVIEDTTPITDATIGTSVFQGDDFGGQLDEIRVYDRALTPDELSTIAQTPYIHLNDPPLADAGPDQAVACQAPTQTVTLDGSGSSDPNGDPLTYTWASADALSIQDPSAAVTDATFPVGENTATLTVDDGEFTDTDTVTIEVLDGSPPEITDIHPDGPGVYSGDQAAPTGSGDVVVLGSVNVSAEASDACGAVERVVFEVDDGTLVEDTQAPFAFTYAPDGLGIQYREVTITAWDDAGLPSTPETVSMTVFAIQPRT